MSSRVDLTGSRILLVDDHPENLKVLRQTLESESYSIMVATSGETAIKISYDAHPDLILLDVVMPGIDGFETCRRLKSHPRTSDIPVIFVTARAETHAVVEGFAAGGVDYIVKPFQGEEVQIRVQTHLELDRLSRELAERNKELTDTNQRLEEEIEQRKVLNAEKNQLAEHLSILSNREARHWGVDGIIGDSPTIRETLQNIERLKNTETSVLITGESGTGKELFARAIHHRSPRGSGPFLPINCSAIPPELAESTLFGHVRGAFTGAEKDRSGYFELAHGGTLFLDEIGDMTPDIQAKLLRVLEDGLVVPVGSSEEKTVDVRIIAATHRDLQSDVSEGGFRQDLYFRLARFLVHVPPLRNRKGDIPLLSQHLLSLFSDEMGLDPPTLSEDAMKQLENYAFPGNIRELKNVIERALIQCDGREIEPWHLTLSTSPDSTASESGTVSIIDSLPLNLKDAENALIRRALEQTHGNIAAAARLLGTNRPRIYAFLKQNPIQDSP